jgi:CxxC motif-containing protein (DUF1111 family)
MTAHRQLGSVSWLLSASLVFTLTAAACSSSQDEAQPEADPVALAAQGITVNAESASVTQNVVTEAPTGFDTLTNGFSTQAAMDAARATFEEIEAISDGLGPVYNAQSCRECHQNPVTGAGSQISEFRAGHFDGSNFIDHPGGSLLNDRAIDPSIQERIVAGQEVRTFRLSLSIMGDGFVEAIDSGTLQTISLNQPSGQSGQFIQVPVTEAPGNLRGGRFGWKNQNSSLLSFAADAYVNEMGITSPLQPTENTSNGNSVAAFDTVADPEDSGADITSFTLFMRSLKAPSRDTVLAATASAQHGSALFDAIGCATCHVRTINTAPAGTVINGGAYTVPAALGDKAIHPFSDFLLHDVGTGDGIVQNGGQGTRNKVRTAPLWGMRARDRLMHDGATVSRTDAILRHWNEASNAVNNFASLSATSQNDIINFLNSL